jgi:hypothetical protein
MYSLDRLETTAGLIILNTELRKKEVDRHDGRRYAYTYFHVRLH